MIIQISSGQGPRECELAVGKLCRSLFKEYSDMKVVSAYTTALDDDVCCRSVTLVTDHDLSELEGTVQWICKSPFRPNHKRKNWFVDVSIIPEVENICREQDIKFERFHCGGKGGQHVNKTETGVRLIHIPTGIVVESTSERSQFQNRKDALRRLNAILSEKQMEAEAKQTNSAWREHNRIVRGNPVRVYEGLEFKRKK